MHISSSRTSLRSAQFICNYAQLQRSEDSNVMLHAVLVYQCILLCEYICSFKHTERYISNGCPFPEEYIYFKINVQLTTIFYSINFN